MLEKTSDLKESRSQMSSKTIVIKVGSQLIMDDITLMTRVASQVSELIDLGHRCLIVSSGASSMGKEGWSSFSEPNKIGSMKFDRELLAGFGQIQLMQTWQSAFNLPVAQVLVDQFHLKSRERFLLVKTQITRLMNAGCVPICNENDLLALAADRINNNDYLAAVLAQMLSADWLFLLTNVAGVYRDYPARAGFISEISYEDSHLKNTCGKTSSEHGTGGMGEKVAAAQLASKQGTHSVICDSSVEFKHAIYENRVAGTRITANESPSSKRQGWLNDISEVAGRVDIDPGAVNALTKAGASLLVAGVTDIEGSFDSKQVISIHCAATGTLVAKGFCKLSSTQVALYLAKSTNLEKPILVHRNDMVLV